MAKELSIGDKVLCRYFNKPEGKFYGETFIAEIIKVHKSFIEPREFTVKRGATGLVITLWRKEIKRRIA